MMRPEVKRVEKSEKIDFVTGDGFFDRLHSSLSNQDGNDIHTQEIVMASLSFDSRLYSEMKVGAKISPPGAFFQFETDIETRMKWDGQAGQHIYPEFFPQNLLSNIRDHLELPIDPVNIVNNSEQRADKTIATFFIPMRDGTTVAMTFSGEKYIPNIGRRTKQISLSSDLIEKEITSEDLFLEASSYLRSVGLLIPVLFSAKGSLFPQDRIVLKIP